MLRVLGSLFVLTPGVEGGYPEFKYYSESFDEAPKGQIVLDQDVEIVRDKGNCFSVICPAADGAPPTTHSFRAATAEELERWLREVNIVFETVDLPMKTRNLSTCSTSTASFQSARSGSVIGIGSAGSMLSGRSSLCLGSSPKTTAGPFSAVAESDRGADKVRQWAELDRPELHKLQIKQLKLVLEHLNAIVPDTDAQLKELRKKCKGTVTTKKEMEDEVKDGLVDQICSQRDQFAAGRQRMHEAASFNGLL